ncbi:KAP family P-loop NTPase fold protein [Leucobacter iarius]
MSEPKSTDSPIEASSEDRFGRAVLAHDFATAIRQLDPSRGVVVSVLGPWGHGKSSFINLMREQFATQPTIPVVDFNPWMFSGTEQLVDHFFAELASQFKELQDDRLTKAAGLLEKYGDSIGSVAGNFGLWGGLFNGGLALARSGAKRRVGQRGSAGARRDRVAQKLALLERPVVVVIDDLDRLTTAEIREIFKLVRLTASFPNIVYLLAFDRNRVEAALEETNVPGREYLEKIIQVSYDLPAVPDQMLQSELLRELEPLVDGIDGLRFDEARWGDIFVEVIRPLVGNMRDIVRYVLSARVTMDALARDIDVSDLLAMEAVRVFRPELFLQLRDMKLALTETSSDFGSSRKNPAYQAQIDELIRISGPDESVVRALLGRVFPASIKYVENTSYGSSWVDSWKKQHLLASKDFLSNYFDRVAPAGLLSFRFAEELVPKIDTPTDFAKALATVPIELLPDVLGSMETFKGEFPESGMSSAIAALLNLIPRVPESASLLGGLMVMRPQIIVARVILRMLEQREELERADVVRTALPLVRSYSSKLELLHMVGHRENIGSKVVPESDVQPLERELADEILRLGVTERFAEEWDLARVFGFAQELNAGESVVGEERSPDVTRAVLESVHGENRAHSGNSRHVRVTPVLAWDWLVDIYGGEVNLRESFEALREADGDTDLVLLASKYARGWRPEQEDRWG